MGLAVKHPMSRELPVIKSVREVALGECASGRVVAEEAAFRIIIMELSVFFSSWFSPFLKVLS